MLIWAERILAAIFVLYFAWRWRNEVFKRGYETACNHVWDIALQEKLRAQRELSFVPRSTEAIARQLLVESTEDLGTDRREKR